MFDAEMSELTERISAAGGHVPVAHSMPHLRWELEQVMTRVRPEDLSAAEITALLAILMPAHSRVIGGPAGRPGLRVVGVRQQDAASQLA
ncbi:hypothetical protein BH11ACT7_BH11ACT7_14800 [soil metagenome]